MRLTKKKAIEISIELWTWLAETGGGEDAKANWEGWERYGEMDIDCALCEYEYRLRNETDVECVYCPIALKYEDNCRKTFYWNWVTSRTKTIRKKYAALFLEQLKGLK